MRPVPRSWGPSEVLRFLAAFVTTISLAAAVVALAGPAPPTDSSRPSAGSSTLSAPDSPAPPSPTPGSSDPATQSPAATSTGPSVAPSTPQPTLPPVAVTVSDRLRVRSLPRVSTDSIKFEPVLPLGTMLLVLDGPVEGSGYTWYMVEPVSFSGLSGPGFGWVAIAGKDGERWVGELPTPVLAYAGTTDYEVDGAAYVRYTLQIANWQALPTEMFAAAPDLPPCGLNPAASRTWIEVRETGSDGYLNGFCALGAPQELQGLWFATPRAAARPTSVYVTLTDRRVDLVLRSNAVTIPAP